MSAVCVSDPTARARRALTLSLWTAGVVLITGSGAVAARIVTLDGSMLTQVEARQDPHKLFPANETVERDLLDVRPPAVEEVRLASLWPATEPPPVAPEQAYPAQGSDSAAADMAYRPDEATEAAALAETTRARAVPGVIECAETCFDAHQAAEDTVETSGGDTTSLPTVTPTSAARTETVALDDLLPRQ